ncbi:sigma-54 interaction domain-containing protein [Paenibacillus beijingensis]|uniref:sigma-54 interaction domain-containing protein n=1 Tax=Paenibacillus beijingensis TaxID=1126833 RepID=UPI000695AF22|nr:sigma 54-interacting transcriptional regulator [Paenibacillus beijingensis]
MKRLNIAVIAGYAATSAKLCSQLTTLLGQYMLFHPFSVDNWTGEQDMDLVMISSHILFIKHSPFHIKKQTDILILKRTLSKKGWDRIKNLPSGNQYLVVNDERDSVVETISLLYELGLRHVDLIPYYPGAPETRNVLRAITPGEAELAPEGMAEVIDVGDRVVEISTVVEILTRFNLLNGETRRILDAYAKKIVTSNQGLQMTMQELIDAKNLFEETLNMVQDGVVTYDDNGIITFVNRTAEHLWGAGVWELSGRNITELFSHHHIDLKLLNEDAKDQLTTINKKTVILNKMPIRGHGSATERVLILKMAEKVEELELKLRTQLRENGHAAKFSFRDIVTGSEAMKRLIARASKMAKNDFSVLILGENGTGKELFAHSIHQQSDRSRFPFIAINCSALPENLLESELFGYEDGAFTGAKKGGKPGLFEQAHRGTIFLDEIGDISANLQIRLLRVLQQKEILKVGGTKVLPVDVRVIAATNRDLAAMVRDGTFREDLYYRLKVLQLKIMPLRERKEDIPLLARYFLTRRGYPHELPDDVMEALMCYHWPGNIRELENTMEYVSIMSDGTFGVGELPFLEAEPVQGLQRILDPIEGEVVNPARTPVLAGDSISVNWKSINTASNGSSAIAALPAECLDVDLDMLVLEMVLEAKVKGGHTGRRNIVEIAKGKGVVMTENQVRRRMEGLRAKGLVYLRLGRSGCSLTAEGYRYLREKQQYSIPEYPAETNS